MAALTSVVATTLFITYPLAVLPVAHVASLFHLVVTLVTLAAVLSALLYLNGGRRQWQILALALVTIAPFVHEAGVAAGVIVVLVFLLQHRQVERSRHLWLVGIPLLFSLFYIPVWLAVPKTREGFQWVGWESVWQSTTFFIQSSTYPLQFLARPLMSVFGWSDIAAVWIIAGPTLIGMVLLLAYRGYGRLLLFTSGWIALTALPSIVLLPFGYVITSPRLLYYPSAGAALVWAAVIVALAAHRRIARWRAAAALALTLLAVTLPLHFIQKEITLHHLALSPLKQMAAITREMPGRRHLVINLMDWVAPIRSTYALGHEGVEVMSGYVHPNQIAALNSGVQAQWSSLVFTPIRPILDRHYYALYGEHRPLDWHGVAAEVPNHDHVWLMTYSDERILLTEAGSVTSGPTVAPPEYLASFEDKLYLLNGNYEVQDDAIILILIWKYLGPDPAAVVFRHVLDCAGNVAAQGDGPFLGGTLLLGLVPAGAAVHDARRIPLATSATDGCYRIQVGLYRDDGSRLPALAADGAPFANDAVPIPHQAD